MSKEIALVTIVVMGQIVSSVHMDNIEAICKENLPDIQTFREELILRRNSPSPDPILTPKSSVGNLIHQVKFDDDISLFTDIQPLLKQLPGNKSITNKLIDYVPKFNLDYVIERLVIGNDITKLPINHITNLW